MARVFISFVGTGPKDGGYREIAYRLGARASRPTRFVQAAELELLGADRFDRIVLLMTNSSRDKYEAALLTELRSLGIASERMRVQLISENLADQQAQWQWFEALLGQVDRNDALTIDMTHGFRAVPIVVSSALGYLQRVKSATLEGVYYGADQADGVIVDMAGFYVIQDWADGISRLLDSADARTLARLVEDSPRGTAFDALRDPALIEALKNLNDALTNIEVHRFEERASKALATLQERIGVATATGVERELLGLIVDKFMALVGEASSSGFYDVPYLKVQVAAAKMLMEHGLLMQGFTVVREAIGSLGMVGLTATKYHIKMTSNDGRKMRHRFAGAFTAMVEYPRPGWEFSGQRASDVETLLTWYALLEQHGLLGELVVLTKENSEIRNGFDHAWTSRQLSGLVSGRQDTISELRSRGLAQAARLGAIIDRLPTIPEVRAP